MVRNEVYGLIEKSLNGELFGREIVFEKNENAGGYLGSLLFGKITSKKHAEGSEDVGIVVKYGKKDNVAFLKLAFHREALFYQKIVPLFTRFQMEKRIKVPFDAVPRCYFTIVNDNLEAIVLEDLRRSNHHLYNRTTPMDLPHQKMIVDSYAKMHALYFAMSDQRHEELESLRPELTNVARHYFQEQSTRESLFKYTKYAHQVLVDRGESLLAEKLRGILQKGPGDIILEILDSDVDECVITHGDGWINNFMFTYEGNGRKLPTKLSIIDWQLASLHSPAIDLSLLIYTSSSQEELSHFEELMEFYHSSLRTFLKELGSDAEKLFSLPTLKEHWHKYSVFGFLWSLTFLRIVLSEDDGPTEAAKEDMFDVAVKNESHFDERLIALVKHHFSFTFKY